MNSWNSQLFSYAICRYTGPSLVTSSLIMIRVYPIVWKAGVSPSFGLCNRNMNDLMVDHFHHLDKSTKHKEKLHPHGQIYGLSVCNMLTIHVIFLQEDLNVWATLLSGNMAEVRRQIPINLSCYAWKMKRDWNMIVTLQFLQRYGTRPKKETACRLSPM